VLKIGELKVGMNGVTVEGTVTSKSETRSFISRKTGRRVWVAEAVLKDDSGEVILVLWNRQVELVDVGDKVLVKNGYVNEFKGNVQLNVGRNGSIEKL
jgi:replication factor A1